MSPQTPFRLWLLTVSVSLSFVLFLATIVFVTVEHRNNEAAFDRSILAQCLEIEALKEQFRLDAVEDYERLDETLDLLGLERTPAIEARAKESRDDVLDKFRPRPCPRT